MLLDAVRDETPALARQSTWRRRAGRTESISSAGGQHALTILERENKRVWIVWFLSALVSFSFVLSLFEKAPAAFRSRSRRRP